LLGPNPVPFMPLKKSTWKLDEEGAEEVIKRNVRALQLISEELELCCANPFCTIPLSDDRVAHYAVPGFGEVCDVCYSTHSSLSYMNPHLKNRPNYFKDLHEAYLREVKDYKEKRRKMDNL
jgi:hypothetical protein